MSALGRWAMVSALLVLAWMAPALGGAESPEYRIGPGDKLNIIVFGQPDLSGAFVVDGSGRISLPLIGQVLARERTIGELQAQITTALDRDFLVDPRVSIEVVNYRPFFILGQVNRPGSYPYIEGMTVRMAVALAGGFTRRAREGSMIINRANNPDKTREEVSPDALVLPGDTVEIERRLF